MGTARHAYRGKERGGLRRAVRLVAGFFAVGQGMACRKLFCVLACAAAIGAQRAQCSTHVAVPEAAAVKAHELADKLRSVAAWATTVSGKASAKAARTELAVQADEADWEVGSKVCGKQTRCSAVLTGVKGRLKTPEKATKAGQAWSDVASMTSTLAQRAGKLAGKVSGLIQTLNSRNNGNIAQTNRDCVVASGTGGSALTGMLLANAQKARQTESLAKCYTATGQEQTNEELRTYAESETKLLTLFDGTCHTNGVIASVESDEAQ
ncbi:hypothetical protein TRVL_04709 [Trypanosoma vivax]|nr:hypothetical protein TRVL_04709 [Trypanosoma vivax]